MTKQRIAAAKIVLISFENARKRYMQTLRGIAALAVCTLFVLGLGTIGTQNVYGQVAPSTDSYRTDTPYHGEYSFGENAYDPNGGTDWVNRDFETGVQTFVEWYWHGNAPISLTGDGGGILNVVHSLSVPSAIAPLNIPLNPGNVVSGSSILNIETLNVLDNSPTQSSLAGGGIISGGLLTDITTINAISITGGDFMAVNRDVTVNASAISGGNFNAGTRDLTLNVSGSDGITGGTLTSEANGKIITNGNIASTTVVDNANFEFRGGIDYEITTTGTVTFRNTFTADNDVTVGDSDETITAPVTVILAADNTITGNLTVETNATLQNGASGSQLTVSDSIINSGRIIAGNISVTRNVENKTGGVITVTKDTFDIGGNLINNAVINAKTINVVGTITNDVDGTLRDITNIITESDLTNAGTIENVKNIIVGGRLINTGTIGSTSPTNHSSVELVKANRLDNSGTLNARAVIINGNAKTTGGWVSADNININGTFDIGSDIGATNIFASGNITVDHDLMNAGNGLKQFRTLTTDGSLTVNGGRTLYIDYGAFASGASGVFNNGGIIIVEGTLGTSPDSRISNGLGGLITGSGVINVLGGAFENNTGGYVSPGTPMIPGVPNISSLTIKGNFINNNGVLNIECDGMNVDQIRVTGGTATINGGVVNVTMPEGMQLISGTKYYFLETDEPGDLVVNSQLAANLDLPVMTVRPNYNDQSYWLEVGRAHTYGDIPGATLNQRNVGKYLDVTGVQPAYHSAYWNFLARLDAFRDANGDGAAQHALDELSGAIYGTLGTVSVHNTGIVNMTLADTLRSDVFKFSYIGNPNNAIRGQAIAPLRWNRWATGYGVGGESENDGNASGYKQSYGGGIFGMDRAFWTGTRFGVYASGADGTVEMKKLAEHSRSRDFMVGLYLRQEMYYGYALASFGFGQDMYKTYRNITFLGETATNKHHGNIGTCYFERGIDLPWRYGTVQPYTSFQIVGVRQENFTEEGAGVASLESVKAKTDSFRFAFGTRTSTCPIPTKFAQIAFTSNLTWFHEFATDHDRDFFARLDTQGGTADTTAMFRVLGNDPKQDWINFGWGVHLDRNSTRVFFAGNLYANDRQVLYTGNGGFITSW